MIEQLRILTWAVLELPLAGVAIYYGRAKMYGSDPTARRALYTGAVALWLLAAVATVVR